MIIDLPLLEIATRVSDVILWLLVFGCVFFFLYKASSQKTVAMVILRNML